MKVIIVGGSDVGTVAAETISDIHDVLVIEKDETKADALRSHLNVSVLRDDGTNPRVLKTIMETQDADVIVSALDSDANNLFICMVAKRLKPGIRTVATVNSPDFLIGTKAEGYEGIDSIISPYLVTSEKMYKLCVLENAVEYEDIRSMGVCVAVFKVEGHHPIVGRIVMQLPKPADCTIYGILRDEDMHTNPDTMEIRAGDQICVFGSEKAIVQFNELVGVENVAKEICILGGSIVGKNLAKRLTNDERKRYVKIIDKNTELCKSLSRELTGVVVVNADYTDPDIQFDENMFKTDTLVSTSSKDDTNLLICMSAKRHNARKIVARFFMREYEDIFKYTDLQTIIGYDRIISNEIIKSIVSDEQAITMMQNSDGMFFTHTVDDESRVGDRYVGDLHLPNGLRIVAIRREGGKMTYPLMDTKVEKGDVLIMYAEDKKESEIIRFLGKSTTELQS